MGTNIPAKRGRPTKYTKELANEICLRLAKGESLRSVCRDEAIPSRKTIYEWLVRNEGFLSQYESCRNIGYDEIFDQLEEIADRSSVEILGNDRSDGARVQARRLQVDVRKWYLSKVLPKKFGEKLDITSKGEKLPAPIYGGKSNTDDA